MSLLEAVISGVVQGVTEFFPVSSSGHLVLLHHFLGIKEPQIVFDIFLHLGTIVAILIFFRKDIMDLLGKDRKPLLFLIAASIPTFLIAVLFKRVIEDLFDAPRVVGCMLAVTGAWLIVASAVSAYFRRKGLEKDMSLTSAIATGIAQGIAIMPGISRSGATIATSMMAGVEREKAFRFSFLLAIPAVLGAIVFKARDMGETIAHGNILSFLAGGVTAMFVGLFILKSLLKMIRKNLFFIFGIYLIAVGMLVMILYRG